MIGFRVRKKYEMVPFKEKIITKAAPTVGIKESKLGVGVCLLKKKIEQKIKIWPRKLKALFTLLLDTINALLYVKNKMLPSKSSQALVGSKKNAPSLVKMSLEGAE